LHSFLSIQCFPCGFYSLPLLKDHTLLSDEKGKFDELVEEKGVKVLIDPKALMHVIGTKMDYVDDPMKCVPANFSSFFLFASVHLFQLLTSAFVIGPSLCS
jgi:hypothetical protein